MPCNEVSLFEIIGRVFAGVVSKKYKSRKFSCSVIKAAAVSNYPKQGNWNSGLIRMGFEWRHRLYGCIVDLIRVGKKPPLLVIPSGVRRRRRWRRNARDEWMKMKEICVRLSTWCRKVGIGWVFCGCIFHYWIFFSRKPNRPGNIESPRNFQVALIFSLRCELDGTSFNRFVKFLHSN